MPICQFFLQGRCRFGQNCRFEHSYNDDRNNRSQINSQQLSNVIKQIVDEVIAAEKGGQWPLSCFAPIKGGSNIPGFEEYSFEEIRWKMYEARANGTLNQCIMEVNQLYSNAEKMRALIKEPSMEKVNLIVNSLKPKKEQSSPTGNFSPSASSASIFGGSIQSPTSSNIFGSSMATTGSIFGGSSATSGNIFGGSSTGNTFGSSSQTTNNMFGNSSILSKQNIFGGSSSPNAFTQTQNVFSNTPSAQSGNIFSSTPVSSSIFSKPAESNNFKVFSNSNQSGGFQNQFSNEAIFSSKATSFQNLNASSKTSHIFGGSQNENVFQSQNPPSASCNIFNTKTETLSNVFSGAAQQSPFSLQSVKEFDSSIYSKVEDLNEEEIKFFMSPTFSFGKIPLKPPLKEYCQ